VSSTNQPPQGDKLAQTLAGDYTFSVRQILLRANNITKEHYRTLLAGCGVIVLISAVLVALLVSRFSIEELKQLSQSHQAIIDVIVIFLMAPITTGLTLQASALAAQQPTAFNHLFAYLPQVLPLALAQLFISILVQLGLYFLIIPGLYVFMASIFTLPLVAQNKLPISGALLLSCKVVNRYIAGFIGLFGVFVLLFLLCLFTLGLALLWVMPLYYATVGLLFNDLFGSGPVEISSNTNNKESTFDA